MRTLLTARSLLLGLVLGAAAPFAIGDQVTITPSKDNTLFEQEEGLLSNGKGPRMFAGETTFNGTRRALLAFNLNSIPAGSTITGVTLTLHMTRTQTGQQPIHLHRVLADWGEGASNTGTAQGGAGSTSMPGDATWIHRFYPGTFWSNVGGDFAPTASATRLVGGIGSYTWSSPGLVADVQAWVNAPAGNYGWAILGDESDVQTTKRFDTREAAASTRPSLTVIFTPPSGVTGACCIGGDCQTLTPSECIAAGGVFQGDGAPCTPNPCAAATGACCLPDGMCLELTQAQCAEAEGLYSGDAVPCTAGLCNPELEPFVDPLPRPAVAAPVTGVPGGEATYVITMTEFQQQLHRDLPPTTVWGYDGSYPGPTIEAGRNQPVTVTWVNDIRDPQGGLKMEHNLTVDSCMHGADAPGSQVRTVVHLHGGHVPADSDGHPEHTIVPGEQSEPYHYPNTQPAATLWYHDHALAITRLNVYMGLAGFYIIRDPAESALGLPAGEFEVPLVLQDRSLNFDGSLRYPRVWHEHHFGDFNLVNGKVWPYMEVKRGKYRFRLLNGANARTYTLSLSSGATFHQIGSDGGLLAAPVALNSLTISPGERADVVINFGGLAAGTEVLLTNSAPAPFPGDSGLGVVPEVMKFIVTADAGHTAPLPTALAAIPPLPLGSVSVERTLSLRKFAEPCAGSFWLINGLMWDDITENVRLGSTEIWGFENRSNMVHPMHIHLVQFRVLDRQAFVLNGEQVVPIGTPVPPAPNERGWKDTVRVNPFEITRVIARFDGDFTGLFAYHCHILEHEDHEMMRQFRATCAADWNIDLAVNSGDISSFLTSWLASVTSGTLVADFNNDGATNSGDISAFLSSWLDAVTGGC